MIVILSAELFLSILYLNIIYTGIKQNIADKINYQIFSKLNGTFRVLCNYYIFNLLKINLFFKNLKKRLTILMIMIIIIIKYSTPPEYSFTKLLDIMSSNFIHYPN